MSNWQDRLAQERSELAERHNKLDRFLDTDKFELLAAEDSELLLEQHAVMALYLTILDKRIARL